MRTINKATFQGKLRVMEAILGDLSNEEEQVDLRKKASETERVGLADKKRSWTGKMLKRTPENLLKKSATVMHDTCHFRSSHQEKS